VDGDVVTGRADPHPWRAALALGAATVLAGLIIQLWIVPASNDLGWWISEDAWTPMGPARALAEGRWGDLYDADPRWIAGPIVPALLAPIWAIGSWLDLSSPLTGETTRPTLWLVYGTLVLAWTVPLLFALRALAAEARRWLGAEPGRLARVQWGSLALVVLPVSVLAGHLEDAIAITLIAMSARSVLRGEDTASAVWLGLAMATKQWSLLTAPAIFAMASRTSRGRWVAIAAGVPVAVYGAALLLDPDGTRTALFGGLVFPAAGRPALFVDPSEPLVGTPFRIVIVFVAVVIGVLVARNRGVLPLLAGVGIALLARLVLEPVVFAYYPAPALAFLSVREFAETGHVRVTLVAGLAVTVLYSWEPASAWIWWLVQAALVVLLAASAVRDLVLTDPRTAPRPAV
jgi:hypothetical protein